MDEWMNESTDLYIQWEKHPINELHWRKLLHTYLSISAYLYLPTQHCKYIYLLTYLPTYLLYPPCIYKLPTHSRYGSCLLCQPVYCVSHIKTK